MGIVRRGGALSEELGPGLGRGLGLAADADRQVSNLIGPQLSAEQKKRVPGYPQDDMMMMDLDAAVAKPETHGLAKGWTASMMGMMSLVRVLPPEKYEEVMARVKAGRTDKPPAHHH